MPSDSSNKMQQLVSWIKKELKVTPKQHAEQKNHPSGQETGLKHPFNRGQVLLRDDDAVEMTSGPAVTVMVDGGHGIVLLRAPAIAVETEYYHLHAKEAFWGYQAWDPLHWWRARAPGDMTNWLWNGPLVANNPGALGTLLSTPFVTGQPHSLNPDDTPLQTTVTLGSLIHAQPLLGADETLLVLAGHLSQLMKTLSPGG